MINENELKNQITKNLVYYRKKSGLTQADVADKISYSDKAISKWERGVGIPDILVLSKLAEVYGVSLSTLVETENQNQETKEIIKDDKNEIDIKKRHRLIAWLSVALVWLIASILYCVFVIVLKKIGLFYLFFIYAIPVSFIIALVFNLLWGRPLYNTVFESFLSWTLCFAIITTYLNVIDFDNPYVWFLLLIPLFLQVLVILWNNLINTGRIRLSKTQKTNDNMSKK